MSNYKIGSARSDERYRYTGGQPGDQRQVLKNGIDGSGEVSVQDFYVHKKGWIVIVAKREKHRKAIGEKMLRACNNRNLGYSQTGRYGVIKYGIETITKTNCDCSSLVRECVKEATGVDPGDFNTATEVAVLRKTGLFDIVEYKSGMKLKTGTILVTKTKGHTAVVVEGEPEKKRATSGKKYPKYTGSSMSIVDALVAVGEEDVTMRNRKTIAAANDIEKYSGTATQNEKLLKLLKSGKLIRA